MDTTSVVGPDRDKNQSQFKKSNAKAILVGQRIDVSHVSGPRVASQPLTVSVVGGGVAVVFRYGAIVLIGVSNDSEQQLLNGLRPNITGALEKHQIERVEIVIDSEKPDGIDGGTISLKTAEVARLQIVGAALSKSVVLAEYESLVSETFVQIEPLAVELQKGQAKRRDKNLIMQIGKSLLSQQRMVGRAEIRDKPELLWERSDLEGLYLRLEDSYEINERMSILERKLDLITRTATTALGLLHTRRGHRLEWLIIILIFAEIVLLVYELFIR